MVVLLNAAVVTAGLTTAVPALVGPPWRAAGVAVGLLLVAGCAGTALFLLPGRSRLASRDRLRQLVDPAVPAVGLALATSLLLPDAPVQVQTGAAILAGVLGAVALTALTGRHRRPAAAVCRGASALLLLGLLLLTAALSAPLTQPATVLTGPATALTGPATELAGPAVDRMVLLGVPPLVLGMWLAVAGARRVVGPEPGPAAGRAWTWLRAVVPATVVLLVGGHQFRAVGGFDATALLFCLAVVPPLVARELLRGADQRRYAARRSARQARLRALVTGARDLILLLDDELRVAWQSPAGPRLFGLADEVVVGRPFRDLVHPDDAERVAARLAAVRHDVEAGLLVARLTDGQGGWRETESTVSDQRGVPELDAVVLHVRDVGECRRLERTVHHLAATDQLTGLANRAELYRALATRCAGRPGGSGAVLVVELHGLGAVNDGPGWAAGDEVLIEVARRLRAAAGARDLLARLTGDEFAVLSPAGAVPAYELATRLLAALTVPYGVAGAVVRMRTSIGLTEIAGSGPDDVLRQADLARRRAVQLGRDRVEWYDAQLEQQLLRRLDLERELPGAAARGELDLVYQPVLAMADRLPVGAEALLRWRSPVLGTVHPAELLPVAESLGLVDEVGRWVLGRACRQLADWSAGDARLFMAVNVTPRELVATDFVRHTAAVLAEHGLAGDRLVVEVAEPRLAAGETALAARLGELRSLGVRTALDGFRTEHASLSQLRRLPLDLLKIRPDPLGSARPMVDAVVGLAARLGLELVAERLESPAQVDRAYRAGCRYGQGYALARPATAERVEAYLAEVPGAAG
ncbi:PAS domain S-box-containing protein/diguanylate cyclase (GGDEF) domain-containing protein [Micromonospora yangpuensis]|uniref:PAS domain S-box-containing protein/diguanylate cyclase (GGDEF) domain-containing protein n=1 Tax=Micromonospora yangpuensis TaxID=683228 RepID=A0A1C6UB17_9ACTN|nr:PAS domain S-box-containing protein/diguanylate cyclase (GGDEF) domain-containing protein [Micromonospora yangpuensis]